MDLTELYSRGDVIYLVRCINNVGIQEVQKLKLRTVKKDYMVGCTEKSVVFNIGLDWINNVFRNSKDAHAYLKQIAKKVVKVEEDIPSQLVDEEEETDDLVSYLDGGDED